MKKLVFCLIVTLLILPANAADVTKLITNADKNIGIVYGKFNGSKGNFERGGRDIYTIEFLGIDIIKSFKGMFDKTIYIERSDIKFDDIKTNDEVIIFIGKTWDNQSINYQNNIPKSDFYQFVVPSSKDEQGIILRSESNKKFIEMKNALEKEK